jgi:DNA-binding winged helix-turn-helix (wHTH) protein
MAARRPGLNKPEPQSQERIYGRYSFGDFTLDVEHRILRCGDEELPLRPKSFEVLAYLVNHHGRLLTKAALMDGVWPDTAVTDNSLSQCIVEIRRALHDDSQQLIRTVARQGYVFAASVTTPVVEFPPQSAVAPAESPHLPATAPTPVRKVTRRYGLRQGRWSWRRWRLRLRVY